MYSLRDYQIVQTDATREAFGRVRRVLLVSPTGSGKGVMIAYIAHSAGLKGKRVIIIVHRAELLDQLSDALRAMDVRHGRIQPGWPESDWPIQIAMQQTITRRLWKVTEPDLLFFDECLDGDSVLDTDVGPVPIRDFGRSGATAVRSYHGGTTCWSPVSKWWKSGVKETIKLLLSDGRSVICTPDHVIHLQGQWKPAKTLKIGDTLTCSPSTVDVAAARRCSETATGVKRSGCSDIKPTAQSETGRKNSRNWWRTLHFVHAGVARKLSRAPTLQSNFGRCSKDTINIPRTSAATTGVTTVRRTKCRSLSASAFSERFWGMAASVCLMPGAFITGCRGRMVPVNVSGLSTRHLRSLGSDRALPPPPAPDTVLSPSECGLPVSRVSRLSYRWFLKMVESALLTGGLTNSGTPDSRGGTPMTGTTMGDTHTFTPKVSRKTRCASLPIGLSTTSGAQPSLATVREVSTTCECGEMGPLGCSSASAGYYHPACNTNSIQIIGIEPAGAKEVFDITVEGTHCFFANGILVHNCHHILAATYRNIVDHWPKSYLLGCTATPTRLDGRGLGAAFDEMILGPTTRELINQRWLCEFDFLAPPPKADLSHLKTVAGDYSIDEQAAELDKVVVHGDAVKHYVDHLGGRPAIAFCTRIDHAEHFAEQARAEGIRAVAVDGGMEQAERKRRINGLRDGSVQILTSCNLVGEGLDIPAVSGAILLRKTKSLAMYLQWCGRVLRPKPDGSRAVILDHVGCLDEHGLPDAPRKWTLDDEKHKQPAQDIKVCDRCFRAFDAGPGWRNGVECALDEPEGCILRPDQREPGEWIPLEVVDGELQRVATKPEWSGGLDLVTAQGGDFHTLLRLADTWAKIEEIRRARQYNPQWSRHVWNAHKAKRMAESVG